MIFTGPVRAPGRRALWAATCTAALSAGLAHAAETTFEGIVITTYQHAENAVDERSAALDFHLAVPAGRGAVELEIKGGTTPTPGGVTSVLAQANAAVGETLNDHEHGRIIPWQLFYRHDTDRGALAAGLIDPAAWIDGNGIANNEFTQFLGVTFLNNPTIDLPAASAGLAYTTAFGNGFGLAALVANATGIEPRFRRAFDVGRRGDGAFAALEVQWSEADMSANLGAWVNSRDHDTDGDGVDDDRLARGHARGIYGNLSGRLDRGDWNLRAGWADPEVQSTAGFLGLTYQRPMGRALIGAGASRTFASGHIPEPHADLIQFELYARIPVAAGVSVTADLQHISHSGFDPHQGGNWVTGVRMGWEF